MALSEIDFILSDDLDLIDRGVGSASPLGDQLERDAPQMEKPNPHHHHETHEAKEIEGKRE